MPDNLDPVLQRRVDEYNLEIEDGLERRKYEDGAPVDGKPGHHAEIWALDQALKDRRARGMPVDESTLEELFLSNKRTGNNNYGQSIVRCQDCGAITRGANDISDIVSNTWRSE